MINPIFNIILDLRKVPPRPPARFDQPTENLLFATLGRSTRYSDRLHDFSVSILKCFEDVYINILFPCTARL